MSEKVPRHNVTAMFDRIAPTYDRLNRILSFGIDRGWRKKILKHLPASRDMTLVDLATGTADQILALAKSNRISSFMGFDLSLQMLTLGQKKIEKAGLKEQVLLQIGNALDIPLPPDSVDLATIAFGIRNVLDPLRCLREMHRILKKEGTAYILEFSTPTFPPFRLLYLFYLRTILPAIGNLLSKDPSAYTYLNQTIEEFPSGKPFGSLMHQAGFNHVQILPLTFGVATLYIGNKSEKGL